MSQKLYGNNISPSCSYCKFGTLSESKEVILCEKKGITAKNFSCRKFKYDPLRRIPKKQEEIPQYNKEDFEI